MLSKNVSLWVIPWLVGIGCHGQTVAPQKVEESLDIKIGFLIERFKDPNDTVRYNARVRLIEIGEPAVPFLTKIIKQSQNEEQRLNALWALKRIDKPQDVVPTLAAALLDDMSWRVRLAAAAGLRGLQYPVTLHALIQAIGDESPHVRAEAISSLGTLGGEAVSAVAELATVAARDTSEHVRQCTVRALAAIGDPAIAELINQLEAPQEFLRYHAAYALELLARPGATPELTWQAVPALIKALEDKSTLVQSAAATALAVIATPEALRAVEEVEVKKNG